MTDLYSSILALLKTSLFDLDLKINENVTWSDIASELQNQCVSVIPADQINHLNLTESENREYIMSVIQSNSYWNAIMYEQQEIIDLLDEAGIPTAVLKGSAAAIYYPKPDYRTMGDIDLIVPPELFDKACVLLEQNGYIHLDEMNLRHEAFVKDGIHIELHRSFALLNDKAQMLYLDNLIYKGINHAEKKKIEDYSFTMLPRLENGLVLLGHISQHLESGLGLRQIIDWMLYVDSELDDDFWQNTFCREAEQIGLKKLALVVTRMCQIYLGLRTEEITWCLNEDEELCREVMLFVMNRGNFGCKDDDTSRPTITVIKYMRSPIVFFRELQNIGCATWQLLIKYPGLKPFAWIYQLIRWISRGLRRTNALSGSISDYRKAKKEDAFLDRLEVRRINNIE